MRIPLFVIAILGLFVTGYLSIHYMTGGPILCLDGGCEIVRASVYAHVWGIPTPLYGFVFYLVLAISAMLWQPTSSRRFVWWLYILTGSGLAVSAVFMYISKFIIHALCTWCVTSAILALSAFTLVWFIQPRYASLNRK